jgi:hypothetical protein
MNVQAIEIQADDENDGDMRPYLNASPEERLRILYDEMRELGRPAPLDDRQRAFYEGRMIELTVGMDEHPEWFDYGCLCAECRSSA